MNRLKFFLRTAVNHLFRGGQRITVAVLCVAFGVMSLVAMTMLASSLKAMLVETPHDLIGADMSLERSEGDAILPEDIKKLDALRAEGVLETYTLVAYSSSLTFHLPDSGELHFPSEGIGVDPAAYPPIGKLTVEGSGGAGLPALLEQVGDVVVSRDLALEYKLSEGDTLILSDLTSGTPLEVHIRGIINDTPNHKGSKLYYSLETAALMSGNDRSLNTVLATSADPHAAQQKLEELGWKAYLADELAEADEYVQDLFASLLNGAGVLGLMVSGVGIANTMQVLMRRRQREIAVWKCMGYSSSELLILFSLEAGLLGLLGSALGAGLGVALSAGLVNLFSRTSTMLIQWNLTPQPILLAVLVGVVTTIVFAMWSIVSSSRVSPVALLRGEAVSAAKMPWAQSLVLILILAKPFIIAISLIMGSLLKGVVTLAAALGGLLVLGGVFGAILWLVTRLLPRRGFPMLNMARGNLQRRGLAPVFALIALFIGVVSFTLALVVTQNATRILEDSALDIRGNNLTILAPVSESDAIASALAKQKIESSSIGYSSSVKSINLKNDPQESLPNLLIGRSDASGYTLTGAPWGSQPDGVYVSAFYDNPIGTVLKVTSWDGSTRKLTVVGKYQSDTEQSFSNESGILLPIELSQSITSPDQVQYLLRVPSNRLTVATRELGEALTNATVINLVAYNARFTAQFHNLFIFAVSMAGLAFLAGMLLMANSVTLSVLDRRFEIGVLKAMGYTLRYILGTLMVEYALIALLAAGTGLLVVKSFLWLVGMANELAASLMVLSPEAAGAVALLSLGFTLITILAVTWKSTRVPALVVLNDRE